MSDHESATDVSIAEPPNKTYKRRSSIFQANRRFQGCVRYSLGYDSNNISFQYSFTPQLLMSE